MKTFRRIFFFFCLFALHSSVEAESSVLQLQTFIEPSTTVYPGQKLRLIYKIYYNNSIDLTLEQLPLLEPKGFEKIGEKDIKDSIVNELNLQEISQEVRATTPGNFPFHASVIEGYAVEEDLSGKHHVEPKLHSETLPVTITVVPFPEKNVPASFNGALGDFSFKVSLQSDAKVAVGNELLLNLDISGKGDLDTVAQLPLECQPGFSGFFQIGNLPSTDVSIPDTKRFIYEIHPLVESISEIPSIEFSSFDTTTKSYKVQRSNPIPITITTTPEKISATSSPTTIPQLHVEDDPWKQTWALEKSIFQTESELNQDLQQTGKELLNYNPGEEPAELDQKMGDLLFQLREYPWAILYYSRVLKHQPFNFTTLSQLHKTQKLLGVDPTLPSLIPSTDFLWITTSILIILSFIFGSLYFLKKSTLWLSSSGISLTLSFLCLSLLLYHQYFSSIKGIVIKPTLLYRSMSNDSAPLSSLPLVSGKNVRVIDVSQDGKWIKILVDDGSIGYIEHATVRLI